MSLATELARVPARPPRLAALRRFRLGDFPLLPVLILGTIVFVAIFAEYLAPHNPEVGMLTARFKPPFWMKGGTYEYLLGTDQLGRDVLSRLIYGARVSMLVGLGAQVIVVLIGVPIGALSGFVGGRTDMMLTRFVDVMYAFPRLLFVILVMSMLGSWFWGVGW